MNSLLKKVVCGKLLGLLVTTVIWQTNLTAHAAENPVLEDCVNLQGNSTLLPGNRADLDVGVISASPPFLDDQYRVCVKPQTFVDAPMEMHGWGFNTNLGWVSFRNHNPGAGFENRGVAISSNIEYGANIYKEANGYSIRGYIWGDNLGWVKMNCKSDPTLNYDKDLCLDSNFGVSITNKPDKNGDYLFSGLAWSETFKQWINFKGMKVKLPLSKLNLNPVITARPYASSNNAMRQGSKVVANGRQGYRLKLEFFSDNGENKTADFEEAGLDFCFIFDDQRKLNLSDSDTQLAESCTDHPNQNWPIDLDSFNSVDFSFARTSYISSLFTSMVPANNELAIKAIVMSDGVNERRVDIEKVLNFESPIQFFVDMQTNIDNPLSLNNCERNSLQASEYLFEYGENNFFFCNDFIKGGLDSYEVDLAMESNVVSPALNLDFYEAPILEEGPVNLDVDTPVEGVFVDIPNQNIPLADLRLRLTGEYKIGFGGVEYQRPVPNFGSLIERYGLNVRGLVKARGQGAANGATMSTAVSRLKKQVATLKASKFKCEFPLRNRDLKLCESDFEDNLFFIQNSTDNQRYIRVSILEQFLAENPNAVVVLKGLDLYFDKNLNFAPGHTNGFVVLDSDVYIKAEVTDIRAHLYADGLIKTVVSLPYERVLEEDASLYSQLAFVGSLIVDNCIKCSQLEQKRLADGKLVQTDSDEQKLREQDLWYLRRSPMEFKFIKLDPLPLPFYADCESGASTGVPVAEPLNYRWACAMDSVAGEEVLLSEILPDYNFTFPFSTNLIYSVPPADMPVFGVKR